MAKPGMTEPRDGWTGGWLDQWMAGMVNGRISGWLEKGMTEPGIAETEMTGLRDS